MALLTNRDHEDRPWGSFDRFTLNEQSTVKILTLKPNQRFSLQEHEKRSEFWRIISGSGTVTIGAQELPAEIGSEFEIQPGTPHRLAAGETGLSCLEIALGTFDEHDETRLADDYGRTGSGSS
jgi:mannose-6-phosphate isomerase-like protein (cupin superfamily)